MLSNCIAEHSSSKRKTRSLLQRLTYLIIFDKTEKGGLKLVISIEEILFPPNEDPIYVMAQCSKILQVGHAASPYMDVKHALRVDTTFHWSIRSRVNRR